MLLRDLGGARGARAATAPTATAMKSAYPPEVGAQFSFRGVGRRSHSSRRREGFLWVVAGGASASALAPTKGARYWDVLTIHLMPDVNSPCGDDGQLDASRAWSKLTVSADDHRRVFDLIATDGAYANAPFMWPYVIQSGGNLLACLAGDHSWLDLTSRQQGSDQPSLAVVGGAATVADLSSRIAANAPDSDVELALAPADGLGGVAELIGIGLTGYGVITLVNDARGAKRWVVRLIARNLRRDTDTWMTTGRVPSRLARHLNRQHSWSHRALASRLEISPADSCRLLKDLGFVPSGEGDEWIWPQQPD